jgi:hypothetical protein
MPIGGEFKEQLLLQHEDACRAWRHFQMHLALLQVASVRPSQLIRQQDPSAYGPPDASAATSRRRLLQTPSLEPPANFTIFRGRGSSLDTCA